MSVDQLARGAYVAGKEGNMATVGGLTPDRVIMAEAAAKRATENRSTEAFNILASADSVEKSGRLLDKFGVERNPTTGEKTRGITGHGPGTGNPEENRRYDEAKKARNLAVEFLQAGGIDGVPAGTRDALVQIAIEQAKASGNAFLASEIAAMPLADQEAWALEQILKDGKMLPEVQQAFRRFAERAELEDTSYQDAQRAKEQAEREKERIDDEKADNDAALGSNTPRYEAFQEKKDARGRIIKGTKLKLLETTRGEIDTLHGDLAGLKQDLANATSSLGALKREQATTDAFIKAHPGDPLPTGMRDLHVIVGEVQTQELAKTNAEGNIAFKTQEIENKGREASRLEQEKHDVEEEQRRLKEEERRIKHELREKTAQLSQRVADLKDVTRLRGVQEDDIIEGFRTVLKESIQRVIDRKMGEFDAGMADEIAAMTENAKTAQDAAIADALTHRHIDSTTTVKQGRWGRKVEVHPIDQTRVNEDYDLLLTQGPKALLETILLEPGNPNSMNGKINPKTGVAYTANEIKDMVTPAFIEQHQEMVSRELLQKKLMTGGISRQDIAIITGTKWGEGIVKKALEDIKGLRKAFEEMTGEKMLNDRSGWERMRYHFMKSPTLLKFFILPGLVAAGFMTLTNKEGATEQGVAVA